MKTNKNLVQFKHLTAEQKAVAEKIAKRIPYSDAEMQRLWFDVQGGKVVKGTCIDREINLLF